MRELPVKSWLELSGVESVTAAGFPGVIKVLDHCLFYYLVQEQSHSFRCVQLHEGQVYCTFGICLPDGRLHECDSASLGLYYREGMRDGAMDMLITAARSQSWFVGEKDEKPQVS